MTRSADRSAVTLTRSEELDVAKVTASPFHVQSTATNLRDGFPYFAFHDSVSALWSQRWRPPGGGGV